MFNDTEISGFFNTGSKFREITDKNVLVLELPIQTGVGKYLC